MEMPSSGKVILSKSRENACNIVVCVGNTMAFRARSVSSVARIFNARRLTLPLVEGLSASPV